MKAQKVLIADGSEEFRSNLAAILGQRHDVRCCGSGLETLRFLRREDYDLLILEPALPEVDGLALLEALARERKLPPVLVVTSLVSSYLERFGQRLGIVYIIRKPCHVRNVAARVMDILENGSCSPPQPTALETLEGLLEALGILPSGERYYILTETILQLCQDPGQGICKEIYPLIARRHRSSPTAIESAIRRTVEEAFQMPRWGAYFPGLSRHPSNKLFLQTMARRLRRELGNRSDEFEIRSQQL